MSIYKLILIIIIFTIKITNLFAFADTSYKHPQQLEVAARILGEHNIHQLIWLKYPKSDHFENIFKSQEELSTPCWQFKPHHCTQKYAHMNTSYTREYRTYCQQAQKKGERIYTVDKQYNLWIFDTQLNHLSKVSLLQFLQSVSEEEIVFDINQLILYSNEIFYDNHWHTMLVCMLPLASPIIMMFDITNFDAKHITPLWVQTFPNSKIENVQFVHFINGKWYTLITQSQQMTSEDDNTQLLFLDPKKGQIQKKIAIRASRYRLTEDDHVQKKLSLVDSQDRGVKDIFYVQQPQMLVKVQFNPLGNVSLQQNILYASEGHLCGTPKVIPHPLGHGRIIFLVNYHHHRYELLAVWDKGNASFISEAQPLWTKIFTEKISEPNLIQNSILLSIGNDSLGYKLLDAITGEEQHDGKFSKLKGVVSTKSIPTHLHNPVMPVFKNINEGYQLLAMSNDLGFYTGQLDFKFAKLGAITWHEEERL